MPEEYYPKGCEIIKKSRTIEQPWSNPISFLHLDLINNSEIVCETGQEEGTSQHNKKKLKNDVKLLLVLAIISVAIWVGWFNAFISVNQCHFSYPEEEK